MVPTPGTHSQRIGEGHGWKFRLLRGQGEDCSAVCTLNRGGKGGHVSCFIDVHTQDCLVATTEQLKSGRR